MDYFKYEYKGTTNCFSANDGFDLFGSYLGTSISSEMFYKTFVSHLLWVFLNIFHDNNINAKQSFPTIFEVIWGSKITAPQKE